MELRPGYKQTDVGMLPEDWNVAILQDCVHQKAPICYGILMPGQPYRGGVPVIKVRDIIGGIVRRTHLHLTDPQIDRAYSRSRLVRGDVLLTIRGTTGRVAMVPDDLDGANITQDTARVRLNSSLSNRFVYYVLQSPTVQGQVALHSLGLAVKGINIGDVKQLSCPLPPTKAEQEAIAEALSDADALIESLEQLIQKKRHIKQGAMQELLTGKRRLPGSSGAWVDRCVRQFGQIVTGGTPPTSVAAHWGDEHAWITPTDIKTRRDISAGARGITTSGLATITSLPRDSVLVTCIASIGKVALLRRAGGCNQQINAVLPACGYSAEFLYYLFEHSVAYLRSKAGITATPIISRKVFAEIGFRVPGSKDEQEAIATVLSDMDAEIEALDTQLTKARHIKQGMMHELLTGRIRLV